MGEKTEANYKKKFEDLNTLWETLPDVVRETVIRIGMLVRVLRRDYKAVVGQLLRVKFEPTEIELGVVDEYPDYKKKVLVREIKTTVFDVNNLIQLDFIHEKTERKPKTKAEKESLGIYEKPT